MDHYNAHTAHNNHTTTDVTKAIEQPTHHTPHPMHGNYATAEGV